MKKTNTLIVIICILLFTSCKITRNTSNSKNDTNKKVDKNRDSSDDITKKSSSKKNRIYQDADTYFRKFKSGNHHLNSYTVAYIGKYKNIAIKKMIEYKIPASITLAQGILESGNGRSELARKSNNHFGIKCHKGWKGKKVYHDDDRRHECFRKYNSPEGSFDDHSQFLTSRGRYSFLFTLKKDNYKAWAKGLKKAGYATDKKYPNKLIDLIETYHLHHYDKLVLKSKRRSHGIENKSMVEYVIVYKGDTLYSIARKNNISVERLKKLNNLNSNTISIGQKLIIEK